MALPKVVTRDAWLAARKDLLAREKAFTKERDALSARRRELPMVKVDKDYVFEGLDGPVRLLDLFDGRRQLIVYHFMFDPTWDEGCPSCSYLTDNIGDLSHLHARDTSLVLVSRAPYAKLDKFKSRMGWTVPWVSSAGTDFNYDYGVTLDPDVRPVEYNYRNEAETEARGLVWHLRGEQHGLSVFLRDGDDVYHTYSTYGRGPDVLLNTYNYLDFTPLGRQEEGLDFTMEWVRHHDRYDAAARTR